MKTYFGSWWIPSVVTLLVVVLLWLYLLTVSYNNLSWLIYVLEALLLVSLLSIFIASIVQFITKSWKKGLLSLFLFIGISAVSLFGTAVVSVINHAH